MRKPKEGWVWAFRLGDKVKIRKDRRHLYNSIINEAIGVVTVWNIQVCLVNFPDLKECGINTKDLEPANTFIFR